MIIVFLLFFYCNWSSVIHKNCHELAVLKVGKVRQIYMPPTYCLAIPLQKNNRKKIEGDSVANATTIVLLVFVIIVHGQQ